METAGEPDEPPVDEEAGEDPEPSRSGPLSRIPRTFAALVTAFGIVTGTVGVMVDWSDFKILFPWYSPPPLQGTVNIVVSEIALDADDKTERDEKVANKLTNALFATLQDEVGKAGRTEVGRAKRRDVGVYRTAAARAERMRADMTPLGGHIAVSGTLVPGTVDRLRVEVYLDRNKLDEAYQLGGLQSLSDREFTDVSTNVAAQEGAQDFLLGKARLYTDLIRAVGSYGTGGKAGLEEALRRVRALQPRLTERAEASFAWLLIGNSEARSRRRPEAVAAYRQALKVDPGSVRARIGLADIDYLKAGGSASGEMCTRSTARLAELRRVERGYGDLARSLGNDQHDLRPRVDFALARTRLCMMLVRGKGPIGPIENGFRAAASAWERDGRKTWLRNLTADAYAMLGATSLLRLRDRSPDPASAVKYYEAAASTAPDPERRTLYRRRVRELGG